MSGSPRFRPRILVVDGDEPTRQALAAVLENCGFASRPVSRAADAREEHVNVGYDVALIDLRLPAERGMDLVRWVDSSRLETRTVLMTTYHDADVARAALDSGATMCLAKPWRVSELLAVVFQAMSPHNGPPKRARTSCDWRAWEAIRRAGSRLGEPP